MTINEVPLVNSNCALAKDFASLLNKDGLTSYKGAKNPNKGGSTSNRDAEILNREGQRVTRDRIFLTWAGACFARI